MVCGIDFYKGVTLAVQTVVVRSKQTVQTKCSNTLGHRKISFLSHFFCTCLSRSVLLFREARRGEETQEGVSCSLLGCSARPLHHHATRFVFVLVSCSLLCMFVPSFYLSLFSHLNCSLFFYIFFIF